MFFLKGPIHDNQAFPSEPGEEHEWSDCQHFFPLWFGDWYVAQHVPKQRER
jgi:hypothetical protein